MRVERGRPRAQNDPRHNILSAGPPVLHAAFIATALIVALTTPAEQRPAKGKAFSHAMQPVIPPAPALSAEDALKAFTLKDGLQVECIAREPLVETPVALAFGADGRIWVVEMRGFMPNVDGRGEQEIPGRIAVLEDTNGDDTMDRKTIFLDNLVMPRAVALARDGVLVAEPPHLWFCRDTNGDGKADEKTAVASDYGDQKNPEHTANGLVRGIDNWIYSLYHTFRYRDQGTNWIRESTAQRTQWGLSQDDFGRLFYTSNSDQLRGDLVPSHYFTAKPPGSKLPGINVQIAHDQSTWPARVNPGVNRAYEPGTLRHDLRLARFTSACGSLIYRGDLLGPQFYGNAFVCEPAGNFVRRNILAEKDAIIMATNAYPEDEFLTSSDERFRPVNLYTGPDGALYVVDMYHGIIQHRTYVTPYLRKQILDRGLERPLHQGRIYRIAPRNSRSAPRIRLGDESSAALVRHLSNPNGWWRDNAQRLLVERKDATIVPALKALADPTTPQSSAPVARLHTLWTLEGMGRLDAATLQKSLGDPNPRVRAAAIRLAEPFLKSGNPDGESLRTAISELTADNSADVQVQLALTLGHAGYRQSTKALTNNSQFQLARAVAAFSLDADTNSPVRRPKEPPAKPLTAAEQKLFDDGQAVYEATCLACHQPHGLGQEGLAPPLVGTEWIGRSPEVLIRIVLHGLRGPIKVKAQPYELDMPSLGVLDDDQIASVLTYVRREWGHAYSAVTPDMVKKVRAKTASREGAWTEPELAQFHGQ
ncbi:MAG: c-type cytochrome [Verrucomicrobia subdivision 3 bacterium]|nr:c-type cytochrome [Limisphaerales bacterium]